MSLENFYGYETDPYSGVIPLYQRSEKKYPLHAVQFHTKDNISQNVLSDLPKPANFSELQAKYAQLSGDRVLPSADFVLDIPQAKTVDILCTQSNYPDFTAQWDALKANPKAHQSILKQIASGQANDFPSQSTVSATIVSTDGQLIASGRAKDAGNAPDMLTFGITQAYAPSNQAEIKTNTEQGLMTVSKDLSQFVSRMVSQQLGIAPTHITESFLDSVNVIEFNLRRSLNVVVTLDLPAEQIIATAKDFQLAKDKPKYTHFMGLDSKQIFSARSAFLDEMTRHAEDLNSLANNNVKLMMVGPNGAHETKVNKDALPALDAGLHYIAEQS